jgi:CBS domain containing-hemolysin-like protein
MDNSLIFLTAWPTGDATEVYGWRWLAVLALLLINAFFVAAEFAMVRLRAGGWEEDEFGGRRHGARVRKMLQNPQPYLSAAQLGITLTSLGLGWAGEPFIARWLQPWLGLVGIRQPDAVSLVSFVFAFFLLAILHVVIGEQVPKLLAIRRARQVMIFTAGPMRLFHLVMRPLVQMVEAVSGWVLRVVLRTPYEPGAEGEEAEEELRALLRNTRPGQGDGAVSSLGREILINALDLRKRVVRDIMTPRGEVVFLDLEESFDRNVEEALASRHTRFPLCRGHLDDTVGLIHIKDLLALVQEDKTDLLSIRRELVNVPELMPLERLLKLFLGKGAHLAVVVDEYGGAVGVVTLDNVLAELVGEIQDEFDTDEDEYRKVGEGEFILDGGLALHDLQDLLGVKMESAEVSTIGGYLTHELGHLPRKGEKVRFDGYEFTVSHTDGRRVVSIHAQKLDAAPEQEESLL